MSQRSNEWHLRDPEVTASVLNTDIYRGLDPKEVIRRRRREGKNKIWHVRHTSGAEYALKNVGDLTSAVLVVAAVTSALFDRSALALAICMILAVGIALRVITYVKARRVLENIAVEGVPSATVIRGGKAYVVRADQIVYGDVVLLEAGDIAPCDGRIASSGEVRVSERGITENKTSVIKRDTVIITDTMGTEIPCEYRVNMIFAGSAILAGSCRIIATACGDDALVSMRRGGILIPSGDEVPVIEKLTNWSRNGSLAMLGAVMLMIVLTVVMRLVHGADFSFSEAFIDAMALASASAFSYLVTSAYISLTLSIRRASSEKGGRAVIKNATEIEKIAKTSCIIASDVSAFKSGKAEYTSYLVGDVLADVKANDEKAKEILRRIMMICCVSDKEVSLASKGAAGASEREVLLKKMADGCASKHGFKINPEFPGQTVMDHSVSTGAHGENDNVIVLSNGSFEVYVCGDIRDILSYCDKYVKDGKVRPLSRETRENILRAAKEIEHRGGTVIATAHRDSPYTTLKRLSVLTSNMCFDGFISAEEMGASGTELIAEQFKDGDISVILLSPRPYIDRGYLAKIGLLKEEAEIISCRDILEDKPLPEGSFIVSVPPRSENREKIDAAAKVRLATVRKLTEKISNAAIITSEPAESGMMTEAVVGAAVSKAPDRPIPQTLKRSAEISVYPEAEAGYGGFVGTLRAIAASISCLENLRRGIRFALTSQGARLAATVLSIIFGVSAMNAAEILLLGMIFDFCAVLVIAFAPERNSFKRPEKVKETVPSMKESLRDSLIGALCGAVAFASVAVALSLAGSPNEFMAALSAALVLTQLVVLSEYLLDGGLLFSAGKVNIAYILYAALTLAASLSLMFNSGFCAFLGGVCPGWITSTVAAACAVLMLASYEAIKHLKIAKK